MKRAYANKVRRLARETFGYETLRAGQEEAIQAVLDGHDTLAVMPTGSGKSAIYQIAALLSDRPAVVVSPLIALQRDQIRALEEQGIRAALVNSTISETEQREAFARFVAGDVKFIFLAPEQFNGADTLERLQAAKPALFVVDEAHCVSEWGHDFRPEYLRLGAVIAELGHPTVLALTATASPPVREEIIERLAMRDARVVVHGFDRPNIWLEVRSFDDETGKLRDLLETACAAESPGIVYVATRKQAEDVATALAECNLKVAAYHAGMRADEREQVQEAFMNDELQVIVATIAFGMGVDKPNVRYVFHYQISDSVDAYYQEIGRAGRDGDPARAILFYFADDLGLRRFFASGGHIEADDVERVAAIMLAADAPVEADALLEATRLPESKMNKALTRLEELGVIQTQANGIIVPLARPSDLREVAEEAAEAQERYRQFERSRVEMMRGYAEVRDCRREYLLNYFGEDVPEPCGNCDNCAAGITIIEDTTAAPFPLNSRVIHPNWGEGLVMRYEGDKMVVLFDAVGYKTLAVDIVTERGLLKKV